MNDALIYTIKQTIRLSLKEEEIVQDLFKLKAYKKGDFFLRQGEICDKVGFIVKGLVRYYINENGEEKSYGFGMEKEFTSNYESFIPQSPSGQAIQVMEDSEIRVISNEGLQYHIASYVGIKPQSLSRIRKKIALL